MLKLRTAPNKRNWFLRDWQLYFMLLLPIAYYILFKYMPMYGTLIAFKKFSAKKGIWGSTWVGFKNFEKFLSDPYFYKLVRNTLLINLNNLLFAFTSSIIFALLLNEMKHVLSESCTDGILSSSLHFNRRCLRPCNQFYPHKWRHYQRPDRHAGRRADFLSESR